MKDDKKRFIILLAIIILTIVVMGGGIYLYSPTLPLPSFLRGYNLTTFTDKQLEGFSFSYDANIWSIDSVADSEDCSDIHCTEPYGRIITLTNKNYSQLPNLLSLIIKVIDASHYPYAHTGVPSICFHYDDINKINENWFSAKNPYYTDEKNELALDRYFYLSSTIENINGYKCIGGSLNLAEQENLPTTYMGEPTIIDIELRNSLGNQMQNVADNIVESIKFK